MVYAFFKRNAVVVHGTLQCLFLQCLFLQHCKSCAKSFGRGFQSLETSPSLTLLYPHTESLKCLSQPSTGWLCPTGQSGMLCDDTEDKVCSWSCPPHTSCILLRLEILLLVLELLFYTFWGLLVISQSPHPAPPL